MKRPALLAVTLLLILMAVVFIRPGTTSGTSDPAVSEAVDDAPSPSAAPAATPVLLDLARQDAVLDPELTELDLLEFIHSGSEAVAADAEITITALDDPRSEEYRSAPDGTLLLRLPRGGCIVRARAFLPGRAAASIGIAHVVAGSAPVHQRIVLEAHDAEAFTLFVLKDAAPVVGIAAALSDTKTLMRGQTDAFGRCDFTPSSGQRLFFFVGEPRAAVAKRLATPEEIAQGFAIARLDHATLTVELLDPFALAAPVAVSLELPPAFDHDDSRYWYATGGDRIEVSNLSPGSYRLLVSVRDPQNRMRDGHRYASQVHRIEIGAEDQTVTCHLEPAPILDLQVENAAGQPVSGARVRIECGDPATTLNHEPRYWSTRNNRSSFIVPTGQCSVHVFSSEGYGVLELNALPDERLHRTVRLAQRGFPLHFVLEAARAEEIEWIRIYDQAGELIRTFDGRIRATITFHSGGIQPEQPPHRVLDLGYYEGGRVSVVLTLASGERVEFQHEPTDHEPYPLPLP